MFTYNNFKSTTIRGVFKNSDLTDGTIQAYAKFDRNVDILGDTNLNGITTTSSSYNSS